MNWLNGSIRSARDAPSLSEGLYRLCVAGETPALPATTKDVKHFDSALSPEVPCAIPPQCCSSPSSSPARVGSLNRADATGVFGSSGAFSGLLPAGATAGGSIPAIACYTSSDAETWLGVAQLPAFDGDPFCGLTGIGTASAAITIVDGTPGWHYYLIAVW